RLLEIGCGTGELLAEAAELGFDVVGIEISAHAVRIARERLGPGNGVVLQGSLDDTRLREHSFDACVLSDVIEHLRDPLDALRRVHLYLRPGGVILIATPSLDSWSARMMGRNWMEFKLEHLTYFSAATIGAALGRAGYGDIVICPNEKVLTAEYIHAHF